MEFYQDYIQTCNHFILIKSITAVVRNSNSRRNIYGIEIYSSGGKIELSYSYSEIVDDLYEKLVDIIKPKPIVS
jgi:hypothetical protein